MKERKRKQSQIIKVPCVCKFKTNKINKVLEYSFSDKTGLYFIKTIIMDAIIKRPHLRQRASFFYYELKSNLAMYMIENPKPVLEKWNDTEARYLCYLRGVINNMLCQSNNKYFKETINIQSLLTIKYNNKNKYGTQEIDEQDTFI